MNSDEDEYSGRNGFCHAIILHVHFIHRPIRAEVTELPTEKPQLLAGQGRKKEKTTTQYDLL